MTEQEYILILNSIPELGPIKIKRLIEYFGDFSRIFKASTVELQKIEGIGKQLSNSIKNWKDLLNLKKECNLIEKYNIKIVTYTDPSYPKLLKEIYDPPIVLYTKGKIYLNNNNIAIVGSRKASNYGLNTAKHLAEQLSNNGFTVVSGFARGIDTAAHRGAISGTGGTIAVFGNGIDRIYPPENYNFMEEMLENGTIISEFPLGTPPYKQNFPRRNRIISGMSLGVVVVEATKYSGSLITARMAAEQGREVFSVPGRIDTVSSLGANVLIKNGAKLVGGVEDIIEEFINFANIEKIDLFDQSNKGKQNIDSKKQKIYDCLNNEEMVVDELVNTTGFSINEILSNLTELELKGLVRRLPGNKYIKSKV